MLFRHKGRIGSGSQLQLNFWHHEKEEHVRDSAKETDCYICGIIYDRLPILDMRRSEHAKTRAGTGFLQASLRPFSRSRQSGLYRLDFKVKNAQDSIASFVLKHNGMTLGQNWPGILQTGTDALKTRETLHFDKPVPPAQAHCIAMCSH
jgi:hypothetical protein